MNRERALKVVLVLVGLLFCAAVYPLILMARQDPALAMMMSLYTTLGIFLLFASRNPSAHRSLIAFTAGSSFAHATSNNPDHAQNPLCGSKRVMAWFRQLCRTRLASHDTVPKLGGLGAHLGPDCSIF